MSMTEELWWHLVGSSSFRTGTGVIQLVKCSISSFFKFSCFLLGSNLSSVLSSGCGDGIGEGERFKSYDE